MADKNNGEIEVEIRREVKSVFEDKKHKLGIDASLDLRITKSVWGPPVVGENVYGAAFPFEKPSRVWIEVFVPNATKKEIVKTVCHELIHIKHPELGEDSVEFKRKAYECIKSRGRKK